MDSLRHPNVWPEISIRLYCLMLLNLVLNATSDHPQLIAYVFGYTLIMFPII